MSLVRDLRERRIVQIMLGYLAAGWVAIEAVDQLVDNELLPQLVYNLSLLWFVALIPAVAVVGWYHGEQGEQRVRPFEIAVVGGILVVLSGFTFNSTRSYLTEQAALESAAEGLLPPSRVAVLYFEPETDSLAPLADGFTESLIGSLKTVRALDVVSANGVEPYRAYDGPLSDVAGSLRAGTLVRGAVHRRGEQIQIDAGLVDGASGVEYKRTSVRRPLAELLDVQEALADEVALFLRERLGDEIEVRRQVAATDDPSAWALFQQAERLRKDSRRDAVDDPDAAWDGLLRADSLLAVTERLDEEWSAPASLRARLAYRRSRLAGDVDEREAAIDDAVRHADRALALERQDAAALEYRGTALYWRYLTRPDLPQDAREDLLERAESDLERAVELDPSRASAYSTLSHLYYNSPDGATSEAALAAQRAYEEDAYLDVADDVLWRLFGATLDLGEFAKALDACDRGSERFPEDFRFAGCRLRLMLTPGLDPDPAEAWRIAERAAELTPEPLQVIAGLRDRMFVAGVLDRAGLADSAQSVLRAARDAASREIDPDGDLLLVEAAVRARMGETAAAIDVLRRYSLDHPDHSFAGASGLAWWWRPLEQHPDFKSLAAMSRGRD